MTDVIILFFVKFFREEAHADDFIKGCLYLNRLSYFKKIEASDEDGRSDTEEAVSIWWQPHDLVINLSLSGFGDIKIAGEDLAAPLSVAFNYHEHLHALCLYTVHMPSFDETGGKVHIPVNQVSVEIDARCLKFGPHAVIIQAVPFLKKFKKALQGRGQWFRDDLVEYYDEATFHGKFDAQVAPFRKQERFRYQNEFRICVQTETCGEDPLIVDIGDISDLCVKVRSEQLNSPLDIKLGTAVPVEGTK